MSAYLLYWSAKKVIEVATSLARFLAGGAMEQVKGVGGTAILKLFCGFISHNVLPPIGSHSFNIFTVSRSGPRQVSCASEHVSSVFISSG